MHGFDESFSIYVGRAKQFQGTGRTAALGKGCAFQHHCSGVTARHPQVRCIGAGVDPGAFTQRPAIAGRRLRLPALHRDNPGNPRPAPAY